MSNERADVRNRVAGAIKHLRTIVSRGSLPADLIRDLLVEFHRRVSTVFGRYVPGIVGPLPPEIRDSGRRD